LSVPVLEITLPANLETALAPDSKSGMLVISLNFM